MYILKIHHGTDSNTVHISSINEFVLAAPILSLAIMDVRR